MEQLRRLTVYNLWANGVAAGWLLSEQAKPLFDLEVKSSFPSLRKTAEHIFFAEQVWLCRLQEVPFVQPPDGQEIAAFCRSWLEGSRNFSDYVCSLGDDFFTRPVGYKNLQGKEFTGITADMIQHCMNHSTYHRGQLVTMLRSLGFSDVSSTDYIAWCRNADFKSIAR